MANFCRNCGSAVVQEAGFCGSCGQSLGPRVAPQAAPPQQPAAAPSAGGGSLVKILLICLGIFLFIGLLFAAGALFVGYKATTAIKDAAERNGIDLAALKSEERGRSFRPCSLLTRDEAQQILGETVTRAEEAGNACHYYIQPVQREAPDLEKMKNNPEELVKSITGGVNDGTTPYLMIEVDADGKSHMAGVKLAKGLMGGEEHFPALKGLADEALLGPMDSMLVFLKNGTAVQIDLRQVPKGRERGVEMARRIIGRM